VTSDGDPVGNVGGVSVDVPVPGGTLSVLHGWTDDNGYWSIPNIPAGMDAIVETDDWPWEDFQANDNKYAWPEHWVGTYNLAPGEVQDLGTLVVPAAGSIRGVVTDVNGLPIVGVEIEVTGVTPEGGEIDMDDVVTDALGQFSMDWVPPGTVTVVAWKDGWVEYHSDSTYVISAGEEAAVDVVMIPADEGVTISGEILNYAAVAPSNADGVALPWRILDDYDDFGLPWGIEVVALGADQTWTLADLLMIDRNVVAFEDAADGYGDYYEPGGPAAGTFQMHLPPGTHQVIALRGGPQYYDGGSDLFSDPVEVAGLAGDTLAHVDITIPIGSAIVTGQVTFPAGYQMPLPNSDSVMVILHEVGADDSVLGRALGWYNAAGGYRIQDVPSGTYYLTAVARGVGEFVSDEFVLGAGQTVTQDITFTYGAVASGRVTSGGSGVQGAVITSTTTGLSAVADAAGDYSLPGLAQGNDTLTVTANGFADQSQAVVLVDGDELTDVDFDLVGSTASLTGTVRDQDRLTDAIDNDGDGQTDEVGEDLIGGATVVAYNPTLDETVTTETVAGVFTFDALIPGDYILAAHLVGLETTHYPGGTSTLSLAPGATVDLVTLTPDHIELDVAPPEFSVSSSVDSGVLDIRFDSDVPLNAPPIAALTTGAGTLGPPTVSGQTYTCQYTIDSSDTIVTVEISEDAGSPVVPSSPASRTFSFDVAGELTELTGTTFRNAEGASVAMMGAQDKTNVYVPPFALVGGDSGEALTLTAARYGEPGTHIEPGHGSVSSTYDFSFTDDGELADVQLTHAATVTLSFVLPAGMSRDEFEATLVIGFYNEAQDEWVWNDMANSNPASGISNISVNWLTDTVTFSAAHFTRFVAALEIEANTAPVLEAVGNPTVDELTLLTFTATASDTDIPVNVLSFSLDPGAPAGALIDPVTGVFTWTPTEAQGLGVYDVTVRVTDDGVPNLDDYEIITITVNEVNTAPVLAAIGNQTIDELTLLTFTATASDIDIPANVLTFSLDPGTPVGTGIDPVTGVFTWTPTEAQGPGVYDVTVRVTDDGTPNLDDFEIITITVNEVDTAPVLASIGDGTIVEGDFGVTSLDFTITLSAPSSQVVTLQAATQDITATAGVDYTPLNQAVVFAPGQTSATLSVAIVRDWMFEQDETFSIVLSNPLGATLLDPLAIGTILNDDPQHFFDWPFRWGGSFWLMRPFRPMPFPYIFGAFWFFHGHGSIFF